MTISLNIRKVKTTDFIQWKKLWDGYNRFYGRYNLPDEITQMTWSRFFDEIEPMYALVAEKNGKILGLAHYLFHRSTIQIEQSCYLQDLFTDDTERGQGIGRALIDAVFAQAKNARSPRVYWLTQENNLVARKLYDQKGTLSDFLLYSHNID